MTLIVATNELMVADGACFSGSTRYDLATPKITRLPDGGLLGIGGAHDAARVLREWALNGMDFGKPPVFTPIDEDLGLSWLWLKPTGQLYRGDKHMGYYEVAVPDSIGVADACNVWLGAYDALYPDFVASHTAAQRAMAVTLRRNFLVGSPIQVEYLEPLKRPAAPGGWRLPVDFETPF